MKTEPSTLAPAGALILPSRMEIIAHRGASKEAPENTVAAYKLAWEQGADAGEVDIYLTADQKIVCLHDPSTSATTGVDLDVTQATFDQLRALDAGSWKDPRYKGEPIPLLDEVLATVPPGKKLYIEIKSGPEILPFLAECIDRSGKRGNIEIIGFNLKTVAEAKKMFPDLPAHWLCATRYDEAADRWLAHDLGWIDLAKAYQLDGLDVNYGGVTPQFAQAVHEAGLRLTVWTINSPDLAQRMRSLGAHAITTDVPALMLPLAAH